MLRSYSVVGHESDSVSFAVTHRGELEMALRDDISTFWTKISSRRSISQSYPMGRGGISVRTSGGENSVRDSLPRGRAEPRNVRGSAKEARTTREDNGWDRKENERKLCQGREIPAVRLAQRFRGARWRQRRRPRLSSTRNEGEVVGREGRGGATRKKVYRLQRSEKLRFRSQHRRHSSASFLAPFPRILSTCILSRPQPQEFGASM